MSLSLQQLARALELEFSGDPVLKVTNVASLKSAARGDLCFIQHRNYLEDLANSECSAVIVPPQLQRELAGRALLFADDPQYSFIRAIELLRPDHDCDGISAIHPSAQVSPSAILAEGVCIGALAVIEDDVEIGKGSRIGAGTIIERGAIIGDNCRLHSRVLVGYSVKIGDRCELHAGAVLGSDGFGLVMHQKQWRKIPQLGSVVIEDDVEIGANTTIDRGALDDTLIERGCKLDNQIQVGHNVRIGAYTAIAACVGIAGSANIGSYCKISGAAVVLGHLRIADRVTITAMSMVTKDIKSAGVYSSGTPLLENSEWHKNNVRYKSLDKLARTVAKLDKKRER